MFSIKKKIDFYDCDPAGILFFARIYELCHSCYEAMIESFNLRDNYWSNDDYIVPIIHSEAKYRNPFAYGQTANIELKVTSLKNSSFELQYECKNDRGELCTEVKTVHVLIDKKTWKKKPLNEEIKKGLSKHTN
jgi:1,4-dihydroxy-2-naphthoyl-CoA hydrolase